VLSMIVDVAMLYALIWTFHIAYAQPAAFYLKVPTFAYIFVFIAVRALRFDPRFVLSQGLFAAAGWLAMVGYAVWTAGPDGITRSFSAYLTDNLILVGAEFDKIFTILLLTGVLTLALYRARATLLTAIREEAATRDMRRYFGAGVAEAITSSERETTAGDAEEREAAILMLDLRGFTQFAANRGPDEVVRTLTAYHSLVVPVIAQHGGMVDKFLGDGLMATFGALRPSDTAAADALRALDQVMALAPKWDETVASAGYEPLPINGAVSAGRVVAATLGSDTRLEFTLIGAATNLAAKLEKHNKDAGTTALTDAQTLSRAHEQGYRGAPTPLGEARVAGVDGPLQLYRMA
jgi:adenylate cyclase